MALLCVACMVACDNRRPVIYADVVAKKHIPAHYVEDYDAVRQVYEIRHIDEQYYFHFNRWGWVQVDERTYNTANVGDSVRLCARPYRTPDETGKRVRTQKKYDASIQPLPGRCCYCSGCVCDDETDCDECACGCDGDCCDDYDDDDYDDGTFDTD